MLDQEIDHLQTPDIIVEIVSAIFMQQLLQERRRRSALGDRAEKFRGRLRDAVLAQQRLAQGGVGRALDARDRLVALGIEPSEDLLGQPRVIRRMTRPRAAQVHT